MEAKTYNYQPPGKLLHRRFSEAVFYPNLQETDSESSWSLSSHGSDASTDSGQTDTYKLQLPKYSSYRNRGRQPAVTSAFGRTTYVKDIQVKQRKHLSTEEYWNRMPDHSFDTVNRLNRPTVASLFRSSLTVAGRPSKPETTGKYLLPSRQVSNRPRTASPRRTTGQGLNTERKMSNNDVNDLVNRLYSKPTQTLPGFSSTAETPRAQFMKKGQETKQAVSSRNNDVTLSYMWTGKDTSVQKIHQCPVTIKSSARAAFRNCSNAFSSFVQ